MSAADPVDAGLHTATGWRLALAQATPAVQGAVFDDLHFADKASACCDPWPRAPTASRWPCTAGRRPTPCGSAGRGWQRPGPRGRIDLAARDAGFLADEGISLRLRGAHVTWAHRLRDTGHHGQALQLLEVALTHFRQSGTPAEQASVAHRLAQLFQWLGQPARAATLLAPQHADSF